MIPPPMVQVRYNPVTVGTGMLYPQPAQYEGGPLTYQNQTVPAYQMPNTNQNLPIQNVQVTNPTGVGNPNHRHQANELRY